MKDIIIEVSPDRFLRWLKRASRALLLAYAVWFGLVLWAAEQAYRSQVSFFMSCRTSGGFITLTDGLPACTRIRSGGMMQL